jgi:hypothetical protein
MDNRFGKLVFGVTGLIKTIPFLRHGVVRMTKAEQAGFAAPRMSAALWDTFTGNTSFRDILARALHPVFLARLLYEILMGTAAGLRPARQEKP